MRKLVFVFVMAAVVWATPTAAVADEKPSDRNLVLAGMAMALPTYFLELSVHEGSHALMAKAMGAELVAFSLVPGFHPKTGTFYLGYTTVRGLRTDRQRAMFLMAPKASNSLLLGGFALMHATDSLPNNYYGRAAVLVLATGFWVDFSRDILAFSKHNDTIKIYNMLGLDSELKRIPGRLVHLGLSLAMGYSLYRGYEELFDDSVPANQPLLLPMFDTRF
tara:strand:+ start:59485 stop:60144 length:660 start_codon:yes stop_codon:yes gene_type:complete